jgi:hypothetical protein
VLTAYGLGFWDSERNELRTTHGIHVSPRPKALLSATRAEAKLYFETRAAMRAELSAYYATPGEKGD